MLLALWFLYARDSDLLSGGAICGAVYGRHGVLIPLQGGGGPSGHSLDVLDLSGKKSKGGVSCRLTIER